MDSTGLRPRVYTLPDCPKCETLKGWLTEKEVDFEVKVFDTEAQLEFIMRNMFGNPPILEIGEKASPSEELFPDELLDERKAEEFLELAKA